MVMNGPGGGAEVARGFSLLPRRFWVECPTSEQGVPPVPTAGRSPPRATDFGCPAPCFGSAGA